MKQINGIAVALVLLANVSIADDSVDNVFVAGEAIKASEMNANFEKLSEKITELRALISTTQSSHRKLVGVSTVSVDGGTGILNMNSMCNATFTGSTMCTTDDILYSSDVSTLGEATAWIHPIMAANNPGSSGGAIPDSSGGMFYYHYDTLGQGSSKSTNCTGWTSSSSSNIGRTINSSNGSQRLCDTSLPIACCK